MFQETADPFSLFSDAFEVEDNLKRDLSHSKRFIERMLGDDKFSQAVLSGTLSLDEAAKMCGCKIDVSSLRPVFDESVCDQRPNATETNWRLTFLWDNFMRKKLEARTGLLFRGNSQGENPAFDMWRARCVNRAGMQLGAAASGITHPPVTFELSDGCSVGCWFCGISADKFKGHASLADGGEDYWRGILQSVKSVIGEGLKCGFCYWATDPLDNPDYLRFLEIYQEESGVVPQTTSAIPMRNVDLTRTVLELRRKHGGMIDRFSILTTRKLLEVHEAFTPEELFPVELVLQMHSNGSTSKFVSGRVYQDEKSNRVAKKQQSADGTIACVSGFLINIVTKTVKLISPTMPSTRWPNGYIIFEERSFETPEELKEALNGIVASQMGENLSPSNVLSFIEGAEHESGTDTLSVNSMILRNENLKVFGRFLEEGRANAIDIVKEAASNGVSPVHTVAALDRFWREGIICEFPFGRGEVTKQVETVPA